MAWAWMIEGVNKVWVSKLNWWKWWPSTNTHYVYRWRLTVVGVGSEEVSAVTRLRMTSMVGRHMRTASAGILFGLSICLRVPREMTTAGGEGKSVALGEHSSFRTLLPKFTWLKLHWIKSPLANKEVETVGNYCRLDWISRIHRLSLQQWTMSIDSRRV